METMPVRILLVLCFWGKAKKYPSRSFRGVHVYFGEQNKQAICVVWEEHMGHFCTQLFSPEHLLGS